MIHIAHRANTTGSNKETENSPLAIQNCLDLSYNVEIDVWYMKDDYFMLGHDAPTYLCPEHFLFDERIWCHAKNIETVSALKEKSVFNYFYHETDSITLTNRNYFWTYPGKTLTKNSIAVVPERGYDIENFNKCFAVCSDFQNILEQITFKS